VLATRERIVGIVGIVKRDYGTDTQVYRWTELAYNTIQGEFNGWIQTLVLNLRRREDLNTTLTQSSADLDQAFADAKFFEEELRPYVLASNSSVTSGANAGPSATGGGPILDIAAALLKPVTDSAIALVDTYFRISREEQDRIEAELQELVWPEFADIPASR
jgi:hypothetical protein